MKHLATMVLVASGAWNFDGFAQQPPPETAANNISFPIILSDNVAPAAFPVDNAWRYAAITDPVTECVGEAGVISGVVDPTIPCYYGRHVTVSSETGAISFDGDTQVWWLQKRPLNFWKALSVGHSLADTVFTDGFEGTPPVVLLTKLAVSAVDVGDLLESSPSIQARQIRTEFNLLQHVESTDPEFGQFVAMSWNAPLPLPCTIPTNPGESVGCFAAFPMSGPVPGTQQSGSEIQGADFGPGAGPYPGTQTLIDPATVRPATTIDSIAIPIQAIVYSRCARLVIQKITGTPIWDPSTGQWDGAGVGAPVVNVAAYDEGYSAEINSGGGVVYGYNWNAKTAATGTYRLSFVLDGNDDQGPVCSTPLLTEFAYGVTQLVNVGETNAPHILYAGDSQLGDEGGMVYLDLMLTTKGGGGGGGGG